MKNIVGENIRKIRQNAGLTQEELALKSGLSQGYINQLESGKRKYTQKSLELIANALSVPVAKLFFIEETGEISTADEKIKKYAKPPDKKEFLALLNELPEHIVDHYLTLLKIEKKLLSKKKGGFS